MPALLQQLDQIPALNRIQAPDPWQRQAAVLLRSGSDVVVQAPTGAGKTLIFELWLRSGRRKGQALYSVPTRALANDKLAEWRRKEWDVGIATGDLSENLEAPVVVGTLEALSGRLQREEAPALLVVDEYQMLGSPDRGLHYELAIAQAPPSTRLLLLSGSVSNPQSVAEWLERLGRKAACVVHRERPVPLEEISLSSLPRRSRTEARGYWARTMARALDADLGPVLLFSPQRSSAERLAAELLEQLPCPRPLVLTPEQKALLDGRLARMLEAGIAYHHSGLSYAARAGIVEPLAKAGQLRVVVATMGLAAGINFSLRSVAIASESYRRDYRDHLLAPDELLQMSGRAGRRGIDARGYFLVSANGIRLRDGFPLELQRSRFIDWGTLLQTMDRAARAGQPPYQAAVDLQKRLFATRPVSLGVEGALARPGAPCGLSTDAGRARRVRQRIREFRNSRGRWEPEPERTPCPLGEARCLEPPPEGRRGQGWSAVPLISRPELLGRYLPGRWVRLDGQEECARRHHLADRIGDGSLRLSRWARALLEWKSSRVTERQWEKAILPRIEERLAGRGAPLLRFLGEGRREYALVRPGALEIEARRDRHGVALVGSRSRRAAPASCRGCPHRPACSAPAPPPGAADLWIELGLTGPGGHPTLRGRVASFLGHGSGLALAASLETAGYPLEDLVFDLANLDAGHRFSDEADRWSGTMAWACRQLYGCRNIPGYLENGLPPDYGHGAAEVVRDICRRPRQGRRWTTRTLGAGDIDRVLIEWRSRIRRIAGSPPLDWPRWSRLQEMAASLLDQTRSPTRRTLPDLHPGQRRRRERGPRPAAVRSGTD